MDCGWIVLLRDSVNKTHHYSEREGGGGLAAMEAKLTFFCL